VTSQLEELWSAFPVSIYLLAALFFENAGSRRGRWFPKTSRISTVSRNQAPALSPLACSSHSLPRKMILHISRSSRWPADFQPSPTFRISSIGALAARRRTDAPVFTLSDALLRIVQSIVTIPFTPYRFSRSSFDHAHDAAPPPQLGGVLPLRVQKEFTNSLFPTPLTFPCLDLPS